MHPTNGLTTVAAASMRTGIEVARFETPSWPLVCPRSKEVQMREHGRRALTAVMARKPV